MDPKLFELLSDLTVAYRHGETIEPEMKQIEDLLWGMKENNPKALSDKTRKIFEYIRKLKKPVTAHDISVRFHLAQSTSATHLRELNAAGLLTKKRIRSTTIWEVQTTSLPVAVPDKRVEPVRPTIRVDEPDEPEVVIRQSEPIKPVWPTNPYKTSYPHIRGYDD
jgi:DNA-binding transcriptional ArsR family regulator